MFTNVATFTNSHLKRCNNLIDILHPSLFTFNFIFLKLNLSFHKLQITHEMIFNASLSSYDMRKYIALNNI